MIKDRIRTNMLYVQTIKPHFSTEDLEIVLVLKGSITIQKVERVTTIHEGEFTLINRYVVHSIQSEGAYILSTKIRLAEFNNIFDKMKYVEFINSDEIVAVKRPLKNRLNRIVVDLLVNQYCFENKLYGTVPEEEIQLNESHLVHMLFSSYQLISHMKQDGEYPTGKLQDRYYEVVEYVIENKGEKIIVEDILKQLYMNATYFSQFMKKIGAVSFKDFVQYRKLIMIQGHLLDKHLCMTEIANRVGINDMKSFYSIFKKYFKKLPKTWREECYGLENQYKILFEKEILDAFMELHHIRRCRETSGGKVYKQLMQMKRVQPLELEGIEIILNPYSNMGEVFDPHYKVYNYFNELIYEIEQSKIILHLIYPYHYLKYEEQVQLLVETLRIAAFKLGGGRTKKIKITLAVKNANDLQEAQELERIVEREIGNLNIKIAMDLAL
ncbi:MAG: helix-turn-helix domain-containing protein [Niameybacter sp.]